MMSVLQASTPLAEPARSRVRAPGRRLDGSRPPGRALLAVAFASSLAAGPWGRAHAAEPLPAGAEALGWPAALRACGQLRLDAQRLACYDAAAREAGVGSAPDAAPSGPTWGSGTLAGAPPAGAIGVGSYLTSFWELDADRKRGTFNFIGYRPNYFLPVHVTSRVNRQPATPNPNNVASPLPAYRNVEAKVQLSIRTKVAQNLLLPGADLWFGYTQQSLWQLYSPQISAPFRSTDHEPELVYIVPMPAALPAGWSLRLGGLGVAHQSNGQALPLSRSWNRVYALAGIERGELSLVGRLNQRLSEDAETNDNPDLVAWRGRLDLLAAWTPGLATATLQWRTNLDRRGSIQLDWTFPVDTAKPSGLRYYVQAFGGHAQTLLDYNYRQTSVGAGVTLFGW